MMTICALLTLVGGFFFASEAATMALDRLHEHRDRDQVVREALADLLLFVVAFSAVVTALGMIVQLHVK